MSGFRTRRALSVIMGIVVIGFGAVVGSLACISAQPKRATAQSAQEPGAELVLRARHEPLPSVNIHYVFTEPVELVRAEELSEKGAPTGVPATLQAVGPVYVRDDRVRLEMGELASVGDTITEGVLENAGENTVWLLFADGSGVHMGSGEKMFVGSVALLAPSYCPECHCTCTDGTITCDASTAADMDTDCAGISGEACLCRGHDEEGTMEGCHKVYAPCGDDDAS